MPSIRRYTDYRRYLADYYAEAKERNSGFSYQVFSNLAGIKSKGFLHNVIKGVRPLDSSSALGLAKAMKLDKHETEYLECLVSLDNAKSLDERNHHYERLIAIRATGKDAWKPQQVRKKQYQFYSELHHSAIRAIIELCPFADDFEWLARNVRPKITPSQARKSVQLLEELRIIRKGKGGKYCLSSKSIATPRLVADLAVLNFHVNSGTAALETLNDVPHTKRNFSSMTLGISARTYLKVCEEIHMLRLRLSQLAEMDKDADRVYQLNFQVFPVSTTPIRRGDKQ